MSLEDNKQIALDFFRAVEARDEAWLRGVLDDNLEWWAVGGAANDGEGRRKTKDTLIDSIRLKLWGDMQGPVTINFDYLTAEEDRVSLTGRGNMMTKGGKPYRNAYSFVMWIRGGKVVKAREYYDMGHASSVLVSMA